MSVVPWELDNPVRRWPWAVYALVIANATVFLTVIFLPSYREIANRFGFVPARHDWLTVASSMFLHAGFWHLAGNMFFLWMFGDNVEDVVGPVLFGMAYAVAGVSGAALHYVFHSTEPIPVIGASGAVSGILGIYAVFFPRAKANVAIVFPFRPWWSLWQGRTSALVAIAAWFGYQCLLGVLTHFTALDNFIAIAFWGHVGGFAAGVTVGFVFRAVGLRERYHWSRAQSRGAQVVRKPGAGRRPKARGARRGGK